MISSEEFTLMNNCSRIKETLDYGLFSFTQPQRELSVYLQREFCVSDAFSFMFKKMCTSGMLLFLS